MVDYIGFILVGIAAVGFAFVIWDTKRTLNRWRIEKKERRERHAH